jgi:putative DNA primase/helicase
MREAKAGRFGAQRAVDELRSRWQQAIGNEYRSGDPDEFDRMIRDAVVIADRNTAEELRERAHRNVWPDPRAPLLVAKRVAEEVDRDSRPIARWRGCWRQWAGSYWPMPDNEAVSDFLYRMLGNALYERKDSIVPWNPDSAKLGKVMDALKSVARMDDEIQPPVWLNGSADQVIACRNGLLRVNDRTLLPHTREFFNDFALPYEYDAKAKSPERWLKFLAEVLPGDTAAQTALQDWFGYVISGRTDLQKMLLLIGKTRSGKGTIGRTLCALVGDRNYVGLSAQDIQGGFGKAVSVR